MEDLPFFSESDTRIAWGVHPIFVLKINFSVSSHPTNRIAAFTQVVHHYLLRLTFYAPPTSVRFLVIVVIVVVFGVIAIMPVLRRWHFYFLLEKVLVALFRPRLAGIFFRIEAAANILFSLERSVEANKMTMTALQ